MEEVLPQPVCEDQKLVAIGKLRKTLDLLEELGILVKENSLVGEISMCVSRALNELDSAGENAALVVVPKRKNKNRAGGCKNVVRKRRSNAEMYTKRRKTLEDEYSWRKYGQKEIHNSKHPRSYYRCTYKYTRGCKATRQAQRSEDDDSIYHITYIRNHTCKDSIKNHHNDLLAGEEPAAGLSNFPGSPSSVEPSSPPRLVSSPQVVPVVKKDVVNNYNPPECYNLSLLDTEILSVPTTAIVTGVENDDEIWRSVVVMDNFLEEDMHFNFTDLVNLKPK